MGTPQAAAVSLGRLIDDGHEIIAVYTQPDRPAGHGYKLKESPVKQLAIEKGIPVVQPTKIKTEEAAKLFRSHEAEVAVVVAYGRILPDAFLTAFCGGAINVHFSLLPKYRGAAPVNWAIANGETETGVTTMKMDAGLDTGDILLQRSTPISENETATELMERLSALGAELLADTLARLGDAVPRAQNHSEATLAPILKKEDGRIDWTMDARSIANRVRGFQPFPTSYTFLGSKRLTIWKASAVDWQPGSVGPPGAVMRAHGGEFLIACGERGVLNVTEIQPEGKKRMATRDFLNGTKLAPGTILDLEGRV